MRLVEIMRVANKAYENSQVWDQVVDKDKILTLRGFFNNRTGQPIYGAEGDGLAKFICIEIAETYDENDDDAAQWRAAANVLNTAQRQCESVSATLYAESFKPRPNLLDKLAAIPLRAGKRPRLKSGG